MIQRIPVQAERDRDAVVQYLITLAGHIASGRPVVDPFGVIVILLGVDDEDVGSTGVVYRHDYQRAQAALRSAVTSAQPLATFNVVDASEGRNPWGTGWRR